MKIKHFDKDTKSKILMSVVWRHLKGNKLPYLSVDIHQVILNGKRINYDYNKKLSAMKLINSELYQLAKCSGCNTLGAGIHELANAKYFLKQVKQQLSDPITYTSEQRQADLSNMLKQLKDHELFKFISPINHKYFLEYLDQNSDRFKYFNANNSISHWNNQLSKICCSGVSARDPRLPKAITDYFNLLTTYRDLTNSYKYKSLPSNSDIWTCEKFADKYSLQLSKIYEMICTDNTDLLDQMIKENQENTRIFLDKMTENYKIETVTQ